MIHQKSLQGPCSNCGRTIRYAAHLVGTMGICPICKQQTEFRLEEPSQEPLVPRRTLLWTVAAILVLVLGLIGALLALKRARQLRPPAPAAREVSVLSVETPGGKPFSDPRAL